MKPTQQDIENTHTQWKAFDALWFTLSTSPDQFYLRSQYRKLTARQAAGEITWKQATEKMQELIAVCAEEYAAYEAQLEAQSWEV